MMRGRYIYWLESKDLSQRTIDEYAGYIKRLKALGGMNQKSVDKLLHRFKNNVSRAAIKSYIEYLQYRGKEVHVIISKLKTRERKIPEIITEDEIWEIKDCLETQGAKIMLLLSYYCALRSNELLNIYYKDFNWNQWATNPNEHGMLKVKGKGRKQRIVPIKPRLMVSLVKWLDGNYYPDKPIFPISYQVWRKKLRKASIKAIGKSVRPHILRHSMASFLHNQADWDISFIGKFLGHKSVRTTEIYAQTDPSKLISKYKEI